jgi:serine/threonine protein kinase
MDEPVIKEGTIIARKYRAIRVIGEGGMGTVIAATQIDLNRPVAIKLVRKDAASQGVERLLREARAAAPLHSAHVSRVLDVGRTGDGEAFLVMEYLEGEDLRARLAKGPVGVADAVSWILEACEGLAEAHARGIVHRDLKPGNIFLARQPNGSTVVKILDFGLARNTMSEDDGRITQTGAILGSPSYMSPEQLSGLAPDPRSDIWALAVTLYELLTGALPFGGRTTPEICAAVLSKKPVSIEVRQSGVPTELEGVIMTCLQKRPDDRPRDIAELAALLEPFAEQPGAAARVAASLASRSDPGVSEVAFSTEQPTHLVSRTPWLVGLAVALVAVVAVVVVAVVVRSKQPERPHASPSPPVTIATEQKSAASVVPVIAVDALPSASSSARVVRAPRFVPRPRPSGARSAAPVDSVDPLGRL